MDRKTLLAVGVLLSCPLAWAQSSLESQLAGHWLGTIGTERERVEVGLSFSRAEDGSWQLRLTQPVANYYAVDAGPPVVEGEHIRLDSLALELRLEGDRLVGHFPGPRSAAELRRVDALPQAQPPPAVPSGPGPRWRIRLNGQIYATPQFHDGVLYVGSTGGVFNAIAAGDGRILWSHGVGAPILASAAVDEQAVYVSADNGQLLRLDRATGKPVWSYAMGDADVPRVLPHPTVFNWDWQAAQPLLVDGVVYLGGADGRMHAIDAASGQARWVHPGESPIRQGAALIDGRLVYGDHDGQLRALDPADGRLLWQHDAEAAIDTVPIAHADTILFGSRGRGLHAVAAADGQARWRTSFWGSWVESTPRIVDGLLYIGSSDLRRVSAIDPGSGKVHWRSDVHGWTFGTPLVEGERIYAGAAGGAPYFIPHQASFNVLDRASGRILSRWPLADGGGHQWGIVGSPVDVGDAVVVALVEGALLSFPKAEPLPGLQTLAEGVYLLPGSFVPGRQPDGNSVLLQGSKGLVVVDSGRHAEHTQRILDVAQALDQPIAALLNTHWHLDHISGNPALRQAYPQLSVHGSTAIESALQGFLARYREQLLGALAGEASAAQKASWQAEVARIDQGQVLLPTHPLLADELRSLAGRTLQLRLESDAVSGGDVWLLDPTSDILIAGDLVTLPAPLLDTACPKGWRDALQRIAAADFRLLVPGHGPVLDRAGFKRYQMAYDGLLQCAASDAPASDCAEGWQQALGELIPAAEQAFAGQLLDYYIGLLRSPQAEQWC